MAKKTATAETAIQTTGSTAMAESHDYGDDAVPVGQVAPGYEHQTGQDTTVPFIKLLQPMSPEVVEQKIVGAMPGMWCNTVTGKLYKAPEGLLFVCGTTRHDYGEFVPRDAGGGFVGRHAIDSELVAKAKAASNKFGKYTHPESGNELVETFYMFGAECDDESALGMAVIAFKSTMIKTYKMAMSQLRSHTVVIGDQKRTPPLFAHLMRLTARIDKNEKGTFAIPVFAPAIEGSVARSLLSPSDDRFIMAKACKELVDAGTAKVNYDQQDDLPKGEDGKPLF